MAREPTRPKLGIKAPARREPEPEHTDPTLVEEMTTQTEDSIREVLSRLDDAFNALGTDQLPGTVIPVGSRNNSKEAGEFVVADRLAKLATTRLKNASEAAEKTGVFGDPTTYRHGETVMVFSDPNFSINVKMGKPSKNINRELVEAAVAEFLPKRASEFLERCFKDRAATKQIIVSMK